MFPAGSVFRTVEIEIRVLSGCESLMKYRYPDFMSNEDSHDITLRNLRWRCRIAGMLFDSFSQSQKRKKTWSFCNVRFPAASVVSCHQAAHRTVKDSNSSLLEIVFRELNLLQQHVEVTETDEQNSAAESSVRMVHGNPCLITSRGDDWSRSQIKGH